MNWLRTILTVLYVAGLLGCGYLAWILASGRLGKGQAIQGGMALSPAALLVGLFLAGELIPESNLVGLIALYAPYFAFAAWALYFSLFVGRGREIRDAALGALLWTLPSLLLTPLALGLLVFLLPPH